MSRYICLILIFSQWTAGKPLSKQLAFPGAEGFGRFAAGGRGGDVYHVTTLDNDGPGSLRYGIDSAHGPRTIVFDISGTIELTTYLTIRSDSMTIAGQSAPEQGICITGYGMGVHANEVILRHLRLRPGDKYLAPASEGGFTEDALTLSGENIIVDHISTSWAVDENLSCGTSWNNVTIQNCLIAEGLHTTHYYHGEYAPDHPGHSMGSLIKVRGADARATLQGNLWIHNNNRNPAVGSYEATEHVQVDVRNNVMYNCVTFGYSSGASLQVDMNYIGNYIIAGPSTSSRNRSRAFDANEPNHMHIFQAGNKIDGNLNGRFDGQDTGWGMFDDTWVPHDTPFTMPDTITFSAGQALDIVLNDVGAFPWNRDEVDARLIDDLRNGTGAIINSQSEVGGYPVLPVATEPLPGDTDRDGIPDITEFVMGMNPSDSTDGNGDRDGDGYTNLEEYLNNRATRLSYLYPPAELNALAVENRIELRWKELNRTESGFRIERSRTPFGGFAEIATVPANTTEYADQSIEPGNIYFYRVQAFNDMTQSAWSETVYASVATGVNRPAKPNRYKLSLSSYPNPFNSETVLLYTVPQSGPVIIRLYDLLGKQVRTLLEQTMPAGEHRLRIHLAGLNSGAYIATLDAGDAKISKKILYLK